MKTGFQKTFDVLRERGYWRINFRPLEVNPHLISTIKECKEVASENSVQFRGWDYPHIPKEGGANGKVYAGEKSAEAWQNWAEFKEIWRLYQSGQFIHYFGLREDWFQEGAFSGDHKDIPPGKYFGVIGATYTLTEIYAFLKNLTEAGLYESGVKVRISLHNMVGRQLKIFDSGRWGLSWEYKNEGSNDLVVVDETYSRDEVINDFKELALKNLENLFYRFNWDNQPVDTFVADQNKLLERRF